MFSLTNVCWDEFICMKGAIWLATTREEAISVFKSFIEFNFKEKMKNYALFSHGHDLDSKQLLYIRRNIVLIVLHRAVGPWPWSSN